MKMETITEEVFLKSDPALENRPYQIEALLSIFLCAKCLVKMFCGTGKSRIITNVIIHEKKELSVVVFPSLALISQYSADYLNNAEYVKHFKKHKTLNVSSEKLENMESTTDAKEIKKFLKYKSPKIILVTYQSYQVLLDCLEGKKIGLVCYDEAHHVVSPETQKLVFGTDYYEKEVFFTATPKNENGITMFDREYTEKNMCGPVAYDYTYLQGLMDEVLNAFEICIDMYTENTNASIYEAMARAILAKGTSRVLSFHSGVNGESNTNVKNFVNEAEFKEAFAKVQKAEFPEKYYYKKITFKGMDGTTPSSVRKAMLSNLDDTPNNEIYIISSCETIGEGVDTKKANMCLFADPKSSITKIIQNIGRVVRRNKAHPLSTILIPCWVNMENYAEAGGDRVKQDELIRQQMRSEKGDYASILNVLGALRQEDPELYEMCLDYSDSYESDEDSDELSEADTESVSTRKSDSVSEADTDSASEAEAYTEDRRQNKRIRMSIHQNDAIQMLWGVKGELDFSQKFCSVVIECEVSDGVEKWKQTLEKVKAYIDDNKKSPSMRNENNYIKALGRWISKQRTDYERNQRRMKNPEIRDLWQTTLNDSKYKEYLCNQEDDWKRKLEEVKKYITTNKFAPSQSDENAEIKSLATWTSKQRTDYERNQYRMKDEEIRALWISTINDPMYKEHLVLDLEDDWKQNLQKVKAYITTYNKVPNDITLYNWIGTQKKNYKTKQRTMKNPEIYALWTETINDPNYKKYLVICLEEKWKQNLEQLKMYIDNNKKPPSQHDKNPEIKTLATWTIAQKTNYERKQHLMKKSEIYALWTETINNQKYTEHLVIEKKYCKKIKPIVSIIPEPTQPEAPPPKKRKLILKKQTAIPVATITETPITPHHHFPPPSEIGLLHKTYLKMRSDTLNAKFNSDPQLWLDYHATRKRNFASYDPASIPSNQIIRELEKIQTKRRKVVVDMGCGEAPIAHHFLAKNDNRFTFHNYDHQSGGDPLIQEVDISALPLEDASVEIGIMTLALWGTLDNCTQYIKEAYRVLESGGKFYISDSTKKWSPEPLTQENGGEFLRTLLIENGFKIINEDIGLPFCLFVCAKIY
jgi:superfamily II DNA or RNA helicase